MSMGMKILTVLFSVLSAVQSMGTPVLQQRVLDRAIEWMDRNPVMRSAGRSVASVEAFPESDSGFVYVVRLSPRGYLILNPDERLPLVVAFSADSSVDLSRAPENAFRSMLLSHVERAEGLSSRPLAVHTLQLSPVEVVVEQYGPFLDTAWNQCNPYNSSCQTVTDGLNGFNDRAPTGCVATAFAQLLEFHRWPVFGRGTRAYTDDSGNLKGAHEADFSDTYDWASMLPTYSVFDANPTESEEAVAELMHELGVAVEADYEVRETTASPWTMGIRLGEHFFFEPIAYHDSPDGLIASMEDDLRAGYPCVVSIPGHSVVADGLMSDQGVTTYHVNYGWGGTNNGWWTVDNVAGSPLKSGSTSLRPRLLAFPQYTAVSCAPGESTELGWVLPKRREADVSQLNVNRLERQTGHWQSDASGITVGADYGWAVVPGGRTGDCWFAGPTGPAFMTLDEVFVPDASTDLTFWLSRRLGSATFSVEVSADRGQSYDAVYVENDHYSLTWEQKAVSLSAYAGQEISLRFALSFGSYYSEAGGVSVDDLAMTSGDWYSWELFAVDNTLASERFSEVTTQWDACDDLTGFDVHSTEGDDKAWSIGQVDDVGSCFYLIPDGIAGTTDHITSKHTMTPTVATRLLLRTRYKLGSDVFRVLLTADGGPFSEVWAGAGEADWRDVSIDLSAYADQAVHVRLEYVVGGYYTDGIWVDSISTQEVTHAELEGQPIHYTTMTDIPPGTHTLAATLVDTGEVEHGIAPSLTLTVSETPDE